MLKRTDESGQSPVLDSTGQSLVEVLVVLALSTVVMVALIIVIVVGLKNAQFAQNQARATKYAQEAIEQVKVIRDRNGRVNFIPEKAEFKDLWEIYMVGENSCADALGSPAGCYFTLGDGPSLDVTTYGSSQNVGEGFLRQVIFEDKNSLLPPNYKTEKWVTTKVIWKDSSGSHESNLQTILTNQNE